MAGKKAPYGTWSSPISAETSSTSVSDVVTDPVTSTLYHLEDRPSEGGRTVLVESHTGRDIVGREVNVRTGVHEYGGGAAIVYNGIAYYSNFSDGRLYRVSVKAGSEPEAITPDDKPYRYACFDIYPKNPNLLVSILEDHTVDVPSSIVNTLCIIDTNAKTVKSLASGADFYVFPRFSPDGTRLAWQQWNHPDMPWDATEIRIAEVQPQADTLTLVNTTTIAGADHDCSNGFLSWANQNTLVWICDKSGFLNPWKYVTDSKIASPILTSPLSEDFAKVMWRLNFFPYAIIGKDGEFGVFSAFRDGRIVFYLVNIETGEKKELDNPYVIVESVRTLSKSQGQFAFWGAKVDEAQGLIMGSINLSSIYSSELALSTIEPPNSRKTGDKFDKSLVSVPKGIPLKVPPNNDLLHVIYYGPHNPSYDGSSIEGEKPPCIVNVHGGPTGMAFQGLSRNVQYFTSRGWAWLDVNYGGSFGYGREYISRLDGEWGVVDVEDCITATRILSQPPYSFIDPARAVIRGSSSGGLTVLLALSHSSNVKAFAAGTSLYGVTDLVGLAEMTHKFESQYDSKLIGPLEEKEKHMDRSPINHADNIVQPLLILHGDMDRVVPKEQAEVIYESVKRRGGMVEYKLYPGEGHGWRRKETQEDALQRELSFYERVFGLDVKRS